MMNQSATGILLTVGVLCAALGPVWADSERLKSPVLTDPDAQTYLFSIPAPRGLILDRTGEVLARSHSIKRAGLLFNHLEIENPEDTAHFALDMMSLLDEEGVMLGNVDEDYIREHLEMRPLLPLIITKPLTDEQIAKLEESELASGLNIYTEYSRAYPLGSTACHVIGFVTREGPRPFGPILPQEPLWPPSKGREGVEDTMDEVLRGKDGIISVVFDDNGKIRKEQLIRKPEPGESVILSLNLKMQELAEKILAENDRPGALVAIDATTGDVLALASNPGYDLGQFVNGISQEDFHAIQNADGDPFFPRAYAGQYPPGSTYKPIVSLAAMHLGPVRGSATLYACGPSLTISGRAFHNWNTTESGYYDVRQALMRSTNTWFYQAGINTGGDPILQTSKVFGLGTAPDIPLDNVAAGNLPERVVGGRAIANLSIGQGSLLVSPLQMAMAMGGIANGSYLPKARLVLQTQSPPPVESVADVNMPKREHALPYNSQDIRLVHQGMWGVVNASRGTGGRASVDWPQVYGKTGTAQWTKEGGKRTLSWFTGFINGFNPRIAFAVVCEGREGETLSGGRMAAPMAGEFLRTIYKDADAYHVDMPKRPSSLPVVYYEQQKVPVATLPSMRDFRPPVNRNRDDRKPSFPFGWGVRR